MHTSVAEPRIKDEAARARYANLPTLPEVTFRILELSQDPDSTTSEMQKLISSDIAMSTRILKVVNSAFYGLSRQIGSIERAIVILGLNAVRNIAIAASMAKPFSLAARGDNIAFPPRQLWLHSTATATAARILAEQLKLGDSNEFFLAGLTHDIGIMAEMHTAHAQLLKCVQEIQIDSDGIPQLSLRAAEFKHFGRDHQDLGREVCEYWNFPERIARLAGNHHSPFEAPEALQREHCIIYAADRLAAAQPHGFRIDLPDVEIEADVMDSLRMTREQLHAVYQRVQDAITDVTQLFE